MNRRLTAAALALPLAMLSLAACEGWDQVELVGSRAPAITDGTVYGGHPSVGIITWGRSLCTATLVGKKTVLTAAHCVRPGYPHTFRTSAGSFPASSVTRHPSYNPSYAANDVALVILATAPAIAPSSIATTPPAVGQELILIGYGKTGETGGGAGTKRMAKNKVARLTATHITILGTGGGTGNVCNGDSGGPSFATIGGKEVQVGVHSTKIGACGRGANDMRVDAFAAWIRSASGGDVSTGGTAPGGDTTPPVVVITTPANGATVAPSFTVEATITDKGAIRAAELRVDGAGVKVLEKPPFRWQVTAKEGSRTIEVWARDAAGNDGRGGITVTVEKADPKPDPKPDPRPDPKKGGFGDTCGGPADCASGLCARDRVTGKQYCTKRCTPGPGACPNATACLPAGSPSSHLCGPPGLSTTPRAGPDVRIGSGALDGGCALHGGGSRSAGTPLSLAALLLLLALRRR